jgi:transcriptional antiterminator RfaH
MFYHFGFIRMLRNSILTTAGGWIVVSTHPHREDYVVENLQRQDFTVYCPTIVKRIRHARRVSDARRPLFPGYLFVERETALHRWRPILGTFGVRSVVRHGDTPAILPEGVVRSLKAREVDGVIQKPEAPFRTGQQVAVSGGPFDGIAGQIIELRENDRVLLLLDILNRKTKIHIDAKNLRTA